MAERRMFAKTIIDSDAFLELSMASQLLYFHLSMRADDDGFVNKPRSIMNMIGAKNDDMKALLEHKFLILFDSGVVVIKHWRIHNYIRKDTYHETKYKFEKSSLYLDENDAYSVNVQTAVTAPLQVRDESVTSPSRVRDESLTQDRLGNSKDIDRDRDSVGEVKGSAPTPDTPVALNPPTPVDINDYLVQQGLPRIDAVKFVSIYQAKGWKLAGGVPMMDWHPKAEQWAREDALKNPNGYTPPDPNDRYNFNSIDMDTIIDRI